MESSTVTLYHYTSKEAKEAIKKSKIIKSSKGEGRDAHFGDGVYFTDMNPEDFTRTEVSRNNYRYPNAKKKLEYCIIVTMPENKADKCEAGKNRRVFLHKGDVNLKDEDYSYEIKESKFKEQQTTAMPDLSEDIDDTATSYQLHTWLSSF